MRGTEPRKSLLIEWQASDGGTLISQLEDSLEMMQPNALPQPKIAISTLFLKMLLSPVQFLRLYLYCE